MSNSISEFILKLKNNGFEVIEDADELGMHTLINLCSHIDEYQNSFKKISNFIN